MKRTLFLAPFFFLAASTVGLGSPSAAAPQPPRPKNWAEAIPSTHVPNLYRLEPDLLRSAQPDSAGFQDLAGLGVKTVLDLRAGHADAPEAGKVPIKLLNVPMTAWSLRDDRVIEALKILTDRSNRPLLVHCQKGADRTGAILALYRVVVQGWTKEDALREMNEGGFHHSSLFRNLDRYVSRADIAALRRALALAPLQASAPPPEPLAATLSAGRVLRGPLALPGGAPEFSY